jgi:CHAT domain-containing protein
MGECFLNDNRTDSAKYYYRRALALRKEYFKNKHADIAVVLMHLGDLFMVQSNIDSALYYYQQAMIHEVPDFNSTDIRQTPAYVKGTGYVRGFVFLISSKAKALLERFTKKDDLSDLKQSFILYSLADSLLLSLRKDYNWEDSRYAVSRNMRFLYEDALQAAWLLSQREDSEIYPAKAFHLMENSKNTLLLEQVRDAIPKSSYKAREVSLKRRIEEITINLQLLNRTNSGTSQSKVSMEIELSQLQRMLQHYYDSVGQFGKSQISVSSISLFSECLKKMSNENAGLLEFYMGDRNVYGIGLAKDKAIFFKVPLTQNLENELQTLFDATRRPPDFNNIKSELDLFSKASATVYGKLFSPFLSATNGLQKLTIIPEGKLALLPPEILLTDSVSNNTDFRSLPYLVRKFNLHLAYSFSILQARETTTQNIKRVTTFSGEYESKPIPGAVAEIKAIAEKFDVKEFSGRDASRQNFLEEALHATALHLAVHGRGDKLKELDSYIMFSDDERDKLYAKELYHLNMNASLIVLASCESGAGVMKPGEGILSLARSFAYAGCPAIVVNLWEAPDFASYQILNRFYDHLSQNEPIAKAISQAKRDYLQSADEAMAHPFYWSGLALTGNVNYQDNEHTIVWFASISLALLLTFIIYRKYS